MERTAIVHIGLPKTGTTSTQNALYRFRDRLLSEHRMFYPPIAPNHTDALCTMFLPDPRTHITVQMAGITAPEDAEKLRASFRERMERDIESADWDILLLSAEGLSNLPATSLAELNAWVRRYVGRVRVLFWTRHPVEHTRSVIQHLLKHGLTLDELVEAPPLPNFRGKGTNAINAFGRDLVELNSFEAGMASPGGIVAAFCRTIGLRESLAMEISRAAKIENPSMSLEAAAVLSSLNRQRPLFQDGAINPLRNKGELQRIMRIEGQKFDLPRSAKEAIRKATRPDVEWLNATFNVAFYPDVLEERALAPSDAPDALEPATADSIAILISDLMIQIGRNQSSGLGR